MKDTKDRYGTLTDDKLSKAIGCRLRRYRRQSKVRLDVLAPMLCIGFNTISRFERGLDPIPSPLLLRWLAALGAEPEWFVRGLPRLSPRRPLNGGPR